MPKQSRIFFAPTSIDNFPNHLEEILLTLGVKKFVPVLVIAILVAGTAALIFFAPGLLRLFSNQANRQPGVGRDPLVLRVIEVKEEPFLRSLSFSGSIIAGNVVSVQPEISGRLRQIYFEEGMKVDRGTVIARISDEELTARLRQIELQIQLAREREERQRVLLGRELVPQQEYDETLNRVRVLEVEKELVEASLERTRVRAPFNGIVGLKEVSPGSMVNSSTRLTTITDPDEHRLEFSVPDHEVNMVKSGMLVYVQVSRELQRRQARISSRDLSLDQNIRSLRLRADFIDSPAELIPGQFARVEVPLGESESAIFVPANSIQREFNDFFVYVFENGIALQRAIQPGVTIGDRTQVRSGLETGDKVLVSGIPFLRPGLRIEIETPQPL